MKEILESFLLKTIQKLNIDVQEVHVVKSNRPDLCDYQCNDVFQLAGKNKTNPISLGEQIVAKAQEQEEFKDYFKKIELIKPGFINMTLSNKLINSFLKNMNNHEKFNLHLADKEETYFLDYGGPNIAKPLHVGHMRTAIIGEALKRIINYYGHKTIADVHLGDYGLQIGEIIKCIEEENLDINQITIKDLDRIYPMMNKRCKEDEQLKEECANITKQLQEGNELYQEYYQKIYDVSLNDIKKIYDYLDVDFDLWLGESDAYPYIKDVENILIDKKLLQESEGAQVVFVNKDDDKKQLPPLIFKKANGAYMYPATDLGTIYQRVRQYHPNHILYVVDARQSLHFTQVFRTSEMAGILKESCLEHIGNGTVNGQDGKPYKTRSGDTPKLQSLFDQTKEMFIANKETNASMSDEDLDIIVNSILKFADLQNSVEKDYIFDINKFSNVTGKTGPYILYTYLRINKILSNFAEINNNLTNNIYNNYDRELRLKIISLQDAINLSFNERRPHYIADYVYELCVCTNAFYQHNHIMNLEDDTIRNDWLMLLNLTSNIIKDMLKLLAIDLPKEM